MRISTGQIFQSGITSIQRAQSDVNKTSQQMASGRRILTPSDDPSGATLSVQLSAGINAVEQYQRNLELALPRLEQEESYLDAYEIGIQRVREILVAANNDSYNDSDRLIFLSEINQLHHDIFALANSQDSNGEYMFAGTQSLDQPFVQNGVGEVSYQGADGEGAVRDVAISPTRSIQVGDTGKSIFMDIPEASQKIIETIPLDTNRGSLTVVSSEIIDSDDYEAATSTTFEIRFADDGLGNMEYDVYDQDGNRLLNEYGNPVQGIYDADSPIEFAGRRVTLTGTPADGDSLISRPAKYVSVFDTLDSIAAAFEKPASDIQSREVLSEAIDIALKNMDSTLDRLNDVRTTVGVRIKTMDSQSSLNEARRVDLESTLQEVRDLDYAEAISRFKFQEVVLQAAQQTYTQVSRLSLFDFI